MLEHPLSARSWKEDCVRDLLKLEGVYLLDFDQCEYGLVSWDEHGVAPAKKPTRIITNMQHARVTLSKRCTKTHRHVILMNGKAKYAQKSPEELCMAMLETLRLEMQACVEIFG